MEVGSLEFGDHIEYKYGDKTESGYVMHITGFYDYEYVHIGSRPVYHNGQKERIVDIEDVIRKVPPLKRRKDTLVSMSHKPSSFILRQIGRGIRNIRKGIRMKKENQAKAEDVKICEICGKMIVGEYDYIQNFITG